MYEEIEPYTHDPIDPEIVDGWKWAREWAANGIAQIEAFLDRHASFGEYLEQRGEMAELNEILEEDGEPPVDPKELVELLRSTGGL